MSNSSDFQAQLQSLSQRALLEPPFLLWRLLADAAARAPSSVWLEWPQGRLTYEEGWRSAVGLAAELAAADVRAGDRVAILAPNSPAFAIAAHAAWTLGAVVAALHPAYAEDTRLAQLRLITPSALVHLAGEQDEAAAALASACAVPSIGVTFGGEPVAPNSRRAVAQPHQGQLSDVALLQFTGGTTGAPKAAMLTHANVSTNLGQMALVQGGAATGGERTLALAPFAHITGLNGVLNFATYLRGSVLFPPARPPAELADYCIEAGLTHLVGPPTLLAALAREPKAGWRLGYVISGGAPLPSEVKETFEAATGAQVINGYGLSEAAPAVTMLPPGTAFEAGSVGPPVPGTCVEITGLDGAVLPPGVTGEICVRGPQVMQGYWADPGETAQALSGDRLRTGDVGYLTETGALVIVDRLKELIIASGYNVYPARVEEQIYRHPAVEEAAVVGEPDAYRGETVKAVVVLKPGCQVELAELQDFLRPRLSPMELPRLLEVRPSLPKSPAGKILRRELRRTLHAQA